MTTNEQKEIAQNALLREHPEVLFAFCAPRVYAYKKVRKQFKSQTLKNSEVRYPLKERSA